MNPKLNQNAKHETQTPPKLSTTAFPQAFATYLIFVQRNIFLGLLLCKYLLSKTSTCLLSCSISYRIFVEGLLRCSRCTKYCTYIHSIRNDQDSCAVYQCQLLKSPIIIIKLHLYIRRMAVKIFRISFWTPHNFHFHLRASNACFGAAVNG